MPGFNYDAGVSGTYTVPAGYYLMGFTCHSAAGGSLVITPAGQGAGPSITLPAGISFTMAQPLLGLAFQTNRLKAGSSLTFAGTDTYVAVLGDDP